MENKTNGDVVVTPTLRVSGKAEEEAASFNQNHNFAMLEKMNRKNKRLIEVVEEQDQEIDRERELDRQYAEDRRSLIARTLIVAPITVAGFAAAEKLMQYYMRGKPPHVAIWGLRVVENLHCVVAFINMMRAVHSGGRMRKIDHIWSVEVGYYFYELMKVNGLDRLHHLIGIVSYCYLIADPSGRQSIQNQNFCHALVIGLSHLAEPFKDVSRAIALTPYKNLAKAVWILHYVLYLQRIAVWPLSYIIRAKANNLRISQLFDNIPKKCLFGSVMMMSLNIIWMYRKVQKFAFPC